MKFRYLVPVLVLATTAYADDLKLRSPVHPAKILKLQQGKLEKAGYPISVTFRLHCGERFVGLVTQHNAGSEHTGYLIGAMVAPGPACAAADTQDTKTVVLPVPDSTGYNFAPIE